MAGGREPGGGGGGGVWRVERGTVTDRSGGEHDTMDGRTATGPQLIADRDQKTVILSQTRFPDDHH
jgi:hypothetical protein